MKKMFQFILLTTLLFGVAGTVNAKQVESNSLTVDTESNTFQVAVNSEKMNTQAAKQEELKEKQTSLGKSGCCSWHNGVCGYDSSTGRIKCCDGTLSPSCTCSEY